MFRSPSGIAVVEASDVRDLHAPRNHPWGPSVSVNTVDGPNPYDDGLSHLTVEMQTGDTIEIIARSFVMPKVV